MFDFPGAVNELFTALQLPSPTNFSEYYVLMNQYDTDENGMIDVQEFIAMITGMSTQKYNHLQNYQNHVVQKYNLPGNYLSVAKNLFYKCDINRSGFIELTEFVGLISELFLNLGLSTPDLKDCYMLMQAFDADGNGKIDFNEYIKMVISFEDNAKAENG